MDTSNSDFADDIVADKLPTHIGPPRDVFLPWHRVRKEYIRRFQWNGLAVKMFERHWQQFAHEEKPLRCLVIPGDDLLDMRALVRDITPLNCYIKYLGFNHSHGSDQEGTRVHIANNAVTSHARVKRDSKVIPDRFEMITRDNSQALRYLKEYGPYHIVNLDFCGSVFPNTAKDPQEYHEAIHRLFIYQFAEQRSPWLLYITTEVEPGLAHVEKMQDLCGPTRDNFASHHEFALRVSALLPLAALNVPLDLSSLTAEQIIQLFGVALGKWMLRLCHHARPQWTIAMRPSYRYTINPDKGVVMLALAFELRPHITPPIDETGVSKLEVAVRKFPDESEAGVKLVNSVAAIVDVDAKLNEDTTLKTQLMHAQADLLEAAGYDRDAYIKWVENGEIII